MFGEGDTHSEHWWILCEGTTYLPFAGYKVVQHVIQFVKIVAVREKTRIFGLQLFWTNPWPCEVLHNATMREKSVYLSDGFNCLQRQCEKETCVGLWRVELVCPEEGKGSEWWGKGGYQSQMFGEDDTYWVIVDTDEFFVKAQNNCHLQDIKLI